MVDGISIRIHHSAATVKNSKFRCMGRSRGGLTTKLHAIVNEHGLVMGFNLTSGKHMTPLLVVICYKIYNIYNSGKQFLQIRLMMQNG